MAELLIKNFGPIKDFHFVVKNINILIGKQASGKSTTAKLLFFIKMIPYWLSAFFPKQKNTTVYDIFLKDLQIKFLDIFGQIYDQNFKITYYFSKNKKHYITISQAKKESTAYITFRFDLDTRHAIEGLLEIICQNYTQSKLSDLAYNIQNNIYTIILQRAKEIFETTQEPFFIPAERTQFISSNNSMSPDPDTDIVEKHFLLNMVRIRKKIENDLEGLEGRIRKTSLRQPDPIRSQYARILIEEILQGKYKVIHGDERIYYEKGHTKIARASSGQKESLWILLMAYMRILEREDCCTIFEEPEAYLFPESQDKILRLFVLLLGSAENNQILITTHSPYLLTSLNNLLAAYTYGSIQEEKIRPIVDNYFWLPSECVSAYQLHGRESEGENIFDPDLKMIRAEEIDTVSQILNDEFESMLAAEGT